MSLASADIRRWLTTYARELEGGVETLRAAAVLRSGKGVDINAEALGTVFALACVYRDAPGGSITSVSLEAIRAVSLLAELLANTNTNSNTLPWRVLTVLEAAKAALRIYRVKRTRSMSLREAEKLARPILLPKCTCGLVSAAPDECAKVRANLGTRSGRLILSTKEQGKVNNNNNDGGDDENNNNNNYDRSTDSLFAVAWERQKIASFGGSPNTCLRCRPRVGGARPRVAVPSTSPPVDTNTTSTLTKQREQVGEMLHILRPCVQLLLLRTLGMKSWSAWGASMAIDGVSMALVQPKNSGEKEELRRRQLQMALYLVRSPLFDAVLKYIMRKIERVLRRIPLVGAPLSASIELLLVLQKLWFYTAGS